MDAEDRRRCRHNTALLDLAALVGSSAANCWFAGLPLNGPPKAERLTETSRLDETAKRAGGPGFFAPAFACALNPTSQTGPSRVPKSSQRPVCIPTGWFVKSMGG